MPVRQPGLKHPIISPNNQQPTMSTATQNDSPVTECTDQEMSVFIPRVFGDTREQIEEVIKLRFDQEGLGIVERVDFHQGAKGLSAFVHFLQGGDARATALQGQIRACSAGADQDPPRMDAFTEVEGIRVGVPGAYWILLENTSKQLRSLHRRRRTRMTSRRRMSAWRSPTSWSV